MTTAPIEVAAAPAAIESTAQRHPRVPIASLLIDSGEIKIAGVAKANTI